MKNLNPNHEVQNQTINAETRETKTQKELNKMLNLEKLYTVKGSATRALNKAVAAGEYTAEELITRAVDGGFQIFMVSESGPTDYCDAELEKLWLELQNVPGTAGYAIVVDWLIFPMGTAISEIHAWFDSEYSEGLEALKNKTSGLYFDPDANEVVGENGTATTVPSEAGTTTERAPAEPKAAALLPHQKSALASLFGVKPLADKTDGERADIWFPFAAIHDSSIPSGLPARSLGGIMRGLINRGLIRAAMDGREHIGKKAVAVCITTNGLMALQA